MEDMSPPTPLGHAPHPHPGRLLPPDPPVGDVARRLYAAVPDLPVRSPRGHVPARRAPEIHDPVAEIAVDLVTTIPRTVFKL